MGSAHNRNKLKIACVFLFDKIFCSSKRQDSASLFAESRQETFGE